MHILNVVNRRRNGANAVKVEAKVTKQHNANKQKNKLNYQDVHFKIYGFAIFLGVQRSK